ncbi:Resolvase, N terminal domain [Streptomyces sp. Ncost-T10-10d]|nr:Resolvase, N terminal domain [Streptomyces sp. Ncost-T10-10d]
MSTPLEDARFELLVAEPTVRTEIRVGYARVSTGGQKLDRQLDALNAVGCRRFFADKKSRSDDARLELTACHAFLAAGDTLVVPALDR